MSEKKVKHTIYLDKQTNARVIAFLRARNPDIMRLPFNQFVVELITAKLEAEGF